ncbi:MAG: helix-hairpin-helix domain-containing protein [Pseudomonadales bacterium]
MTPVVIAAAPKKKAAAKKASPDAPGLQTAAAADKISFGGKKYKLDDLKIVEGIGPKIEGLLNEAGINSWAELAAADVEMLRTVLADAGSRYSVHNPETWPQQAGLCAKQSWDELQTLQDALDGGRVVS